MKNEEWNQERYWYAVHVRSRHEFSVVETLTKAGKEAFLPTVERMRKWKDRKKMLEFPLFPGYLFVYMKKNTDDRLSLLKTKGVVQLLGTIPGEAESVPEEQIDSLKKLVASKEVLDPYPYLKEGQKVRITRNALAGVEGILVEKQGQHVLVISVDILQQGVSLKVDASEVEPV